MNKYLLSLLLAAIGSSNLFGADIVFKRKSVLAEGTWIKIGVQQSGVYEISYQTLRDMGFDDPSKVSLYGRGGTVLPLNFKSVTGTVQLNDDLSQVPVYHKNNKLYFYGQGVENIRYKTSRNAPQGGIFEKDSKNIYSDKGYYFLTDSGSPKTLQAGRIPGSQTIDMRSEAVAFVHHENDLFQNNSGTGQLFWGERICTPGPSRLSWDVDLPDAVSGASGWMRCDFYIDKDKEYATLSYGMENTSQVVSFTTKEFSSSDFLPQTPNAGTVGITSGKGKVFVSFDSTYDHDEANLDFWTLTYPTHIPTLTGSGYYGHAQQRIVFPAVGTGYGYGFNMENAASFTVFDISNPAAPQYLPVSLEAGKGVVRSISTAYSPDLVIFDNSKPQLQISGYEAAFSPIANQDLHAHAEEGADMLIISTPEFLEYAEEIAEIHRQKDAMKVVVATPEQCYNEFSSGVPDPMAYRSLAKMLYSGATPLKYMLLMGPMYADMRGITVKKSPFEGIVAYQNSPVSIERGSPNINDYLGMMSNYLSSESLERNPVEVAVAVLPVKFPYEAEIYVKKVRDFYEKDDFAWSLNRILNVGGINDNHAHAKQALEIGNTVINNIDDRATINTNLAIDAYGYVPARNKMVNTLEEGVMYYSYFGHGAEGYLGQSTQFFNSPDVLNLKNTTLPLVTFAGCNLSKFDIGRRGMGESIVTGTPHGGIASVLATRESWSGQNMEFFRSFYTLMFKTGTETRDPRRTETPAIGDIYVRTKSLSTYNNELAYQLIGDPALRIPSCIRPINIDGTDLEAIAGEPVEISGYVCDADGNPDTSFNGELVARYMEPKTRILSQDVITNTKNTKTDSHGNPVELYVDYVDNQAAIGTAKVENGRFIVKINVPGYTEKFNGSIGRLHLCAFSQEKRLGAGTMVPMTYRSSEDAITSEAADKTAPSIDRIDFNAADLTLTIAASDNYALGLSTNVYPRQFTVSVDGKELRNALNSKLVLTDGPKAYERTIPLYGLTYGSHNVRVSQSDAAGNSTVREVVITYTPGSGKLSLTADNFDAGDGVTFAVSGEAADGNETILYILDAAGNEVFSDSFTGMTYNWDRTDNNGDTLVPGRYKAYVLKRGTGLSGTHSATVDIPVV